MDLKNLIICSKSEYTTIYNIKHRQIHMYMYVKERGGGSIIHYINKDFEKIIKLFFNIYYII